MMNRLSGTSLRVRVGLAVAAMVGAVVLTFASGSVAFVVAIIAGGAAGYLTKG